VQSLLADPNAGAQLQQAMPNLQPMQLQQLASVGLDGSQVPAMVSVANAPGGVPDVELAPPPGTPQGIGGLNWKAGVHFSPLTGSPIFVDKGRTWFAGSLSVHGVLILHPFTISQMNSTGLTLVTNPGGICLDIELPSSGYYLFSIKTNKLDAKTMSWVAMLGSGTGGPRIEIRTSWMSAPQKLTFSPLTDGTGLVATGYVKAGGTQLSVPTGMRTTSAQLTLNWKTLAIKGMLFGGITVTQL
jgi:hypothetical protein